MSDHGPTVLTVAQIPHLDKQGVCDCDCPSCATADDDVCICPDCNTEACGLHNPITRT